MRTAISSIILVLMMVSYGAAQDKAGSTTICDNLLKSGQLEAALNCYQRALQDDPRNSVVNLRVCQILEALGKVNEMEPYFSRVDRDLTETRDFLEQLSSNYGDLQVTCSGKVSCPIFFEAKSRLQFAPPEDLESGKSKRLAVINEKYGGREGLWFQKAGENTYSTRIDWFPIVTGTPLPYTADISGHSYSFTFNFLQKDALGVEASDFDSILCAVPDTFAEFQVATDDPDFEATLVHVAPDTSGMIFAQGRYYIPRGEMPSLDFRKKGRTILNKKYLVITSLILTSAVMLIQR